MGEWKRILFSQLLLLFFNFIAASEAYGNSWARDWIQATGENFMVAVATLDPFNPLHQARDWTYTSAETQTAVVRFLTPYTMIETPLHFRHIIKNFCGGGRSEFNLSYTVDVLLRYLNIQMERYCMVTFAFMTITLMEQKGCTGSSRRGAVVNESD